MKMNIRLIKDLEMTDLSGEKVMIDYDSGNYFLMKGVAGEIYELIRQGNTIQGIKETLLEEFEVSEEECESSLNTFLVKLKDYGFIEIQ